MFSSAGCDVATRTTSTPSSYSLATMSLAVSVSVTLLANEIERASTHASSGLMPTPSNTSTRLRICSRDRPLRVALDKRPGGSVTLVTLFMMRAARILAVAVISSRPNPGTAERSTAARARRVRPRF